MFARAQPCKRLLHSYSSSSRVPLLSTRFQSRAPLVPRSFSSSRTLCSYPAPNFERALAPTQIQRSGTGLWSAVIVLGVALGGAFLVPLVRSSANETPAKRDETGQFDVADLTDSYLVMAPNTPPGRPGTLTVDEEKKLRELWGMTMKVFGVEAGPEETNGVDAQSVATSTTDTASEKDGKKEKKKSRLNVFKRNKEEKAEAKTDATTATSTPDISRISISAEDDKFGQTAEFKAAIANTPPEELRRAFWSMVKHDHPDALLLRFLRARKWDVEKALVMMISTMHWRLDEMHVDDDIVKNGELAALDEAKGAGEVKAKKNSEDFLTQLRMGKSYLHGLDSEGRPLCFVRARLHRAGEQTEQSLERFTVYTIETARMLLRPPIDTATIVFDMTDFSMANMDYTPVKFMIKCFEANYPESLGTVLVYKAPWVFNAIWSIIRGWLDPVVASKVHFAKDIKELEKFVPRNQIPTELGGDEKWTYEYPEPVPGENDKMKDTETKGKLEEERNTSVEKYEATIKDWVKNPEAKTLEERRKERDAVAEELRSNYWKLDPYVRARTLYDRIGVIGDSGKLDFYPAKKEAAAPAAVATNDDDVD